MANRQTSRGAAGCGRRNAGGTAPDPRAVNSAAYYLQRFGGSLSRAKKAAAQYPGSAPIGGISAAAWRAAQQRISEQKKAQRKADQEGEGRAPARPRAAESSQLSLFNPAGLKFVFKGSCPKVGQTFADTYGDSWRVVKVGALSGGRRGVSAAPVRSKPDFAGRPADVVIPRSARKRRNPDDAAAVAASEGFHGRAASEVTVIETPVKVHGQLAELGDLISLEVRALNGNVVELSNFEGALLAMSPARNQLYIEGGDQIVNLEDFGIDPDSAHDSEILGHCRRVRYYTTKDHLGDEGGEATYKHRFGEAGGLEPHLVYDCVNGLLSFAGGSYTIPDEGITD